jgi:hypothetical protein
MDRPRNKQNGFSQCENVLKAALALILTQADDFVGSFGDRLAAIGGQSIRSE